jgi:LmbE family N-acetylglucosaminyl deacetylase
MKRPLRLLCIVAHPDDESLGLGGTLAKYSTEGVQTFVVTATRGERGRDRTTTGRPGGKKLGSVRELEARAAAEILGVREMSFLDFPDGGLDRVDPRAVITAVSAHILRIRPQVVVTMPPCGCDGHPDHVALSHLVTAAVVRAAEAGRAAGPGGKPIVSKLYDFVMTRATWDAFRATLAPAVCRVDGVDRAPVPWPEWAVSAELETGSYWRIVWRVVQCHRTQLQGRPGLARLGDEGHRALWGVQRFYRAFSLVGGGRLPETDLFAGLR